MLCDLWQWSLKPAGMCKQLLKGLMLPPCSYRGYGLSQGKPNEPGLQMDAQAALEYLTTDSAVNKDNVGLCMPMLTVSLFIVLQNSLIATADCFKLVSLMADLACQGLQPGLCIY